VQNHTSNNPHADEQTMLQLFHRNDLSYDDKMKAFIPLIQKALSSDASATTKASPPKPKKP